MTTVEKMKKDLNKISVDRDQLNEILKDRLDFGFDSIYFRYSEVIEELSWFKQDEARKNGNMSFNRKNWCDTRREHFYKILEQLVRAHENQKEND